MKNSVKLPSDFYERLYESIMDYGFDPESEDEKTCSMSITIDNISIELDATFDVYTEDNSFDHEFGTEYGYSLKVGELEDFEIFNMYDDESDADVTDLFDYDKFWLQFKQFVIKRGSHYIHHGDEVVTRSQMSWKGNRWIKSTFLYYDTRLGLAICTPNIHAKNVSKIAYPCVFPCTTANLRLVK